MKRVEKQFINGQTLWRAHFRGVNSYHLTRSEARAWWDEQYALAQPSTVVIEVPRGDYSEDK